MSFLVITAVANNIRHDVTTRAVDVTTGSDAVVSMPATSARPHVANGATVCVVTNPTLAQRPAAAAAADAILSAAAASRCLINSLKVSSFAVATLAAASVVRKSVVQRISLGCLPV